MEKISSKKFTAIFLTILMCAVFACLATACAKDKPVTEGTLDSLSIESIVAAPKGAELEDLSDEYLENSTKMTKLLTKADLNLPKELTDPNSAWPMGLMIYNGKDFVPATDKALFDENKKTFIFCHGMGGNEHWHNAEKFSKEYNVLSFYWGAFGDERSTPEGLGRVGNKVWFRDGDKRFAKVPVPQKDSDWYDGKDINYSVTEIYAAYYLDLLREHPNYSTKEITLAGHSYGGIISIGLISYLTSALRSGLLETRFLPDRLIFCDTYLHPGAKGKHIAWLNDMENPEKGGVVSLTYQTLIIARNLGIAVSLLRSNNFIAAFGLVAVGQEGLDKINSNTFYIDGPADKDLDLSNAHNYGFIWPNKIFGPAFDTKNKNDYAFSLFNPYHADFARVGERYFLDYNHTLSVVRNDTTDTLDDKIELQNRTKTKLYGFVFKDENKNDILDERLAKHILGAKVTIKDSTGKVILDSTTSLNGYFEVDVTPGKYTVSVGGPYDLQKEITVKNGTFFVPAMMGVK